MRRYISMEEISDGKLYTAKDLVKADCLGCQGCSKCCRGMGESIVLDPCDIYRLSGGLGKELPILMEEGSVALNVVDGIVLPYLTMSGQEEACAFLDGNGRCSIHEYRPGICRLFPLGRYYEEDDFRYFLQTKECGHARAKVQVGKWLDTPRLSEYEDFVREWHGILKQARELLAENTEEEFGKNLNLFLLRTFFMEPWGAEDFYVLFRMRVERYRSIVPV